MSNPVFWEKKKEKNISKRRLLNFHSSMLDVKRDWIHLVDLPSFLTLSTLGKNSKRRHFKIYFPFFFSENRLLHHANCPITRQFV